MSLYRTSLPSTHSQTLTALSRLPITPTPSRYVLPSPSLLRLCVRSCLPYARRRDAVRQPTLQVQPDASEKLPWCDLQADLQAIPRTPATVLPTGCRSLPRLWWSEPLRRSCSVRPLASYNS